MFLAVVGERQPPASLDPSISAKQRSAQVGVALDRLVFPDHQELPGPSCDGGVAVIHLAVAEEDSAWVEHLPRPAHPRGVDLAKPLVGRDLFPDNQELRSVPGHIHVTLHVADSPGRQHLFAPHRQRIGPGSRERGLFRHPASDDPRHGEHRGRDGDDQDPPNGKWIREHGHTAPSTPPFPTLDPGRRARQRRAFVSFGGIPRGVYRVRQVTQGDHKESRWRRPT